MRCALHAMIWICIDTTSNMLALDSLRCLKEVRPQAAGEALNGTHWPLTIGLGFKLAPLQHPGPAPANQLWLRLAACGVADGCVRGSSRICMDLHPFGGCQDSIWYPRMPFMLSLCMHTIMPLLFLIEVTDGILFETPLLPVLIRFVRI